MKEGHQLMRAWGSVGASVLQAVKVASMAARAWGGGESGKAQAGKALAAIIWGGWA